MERKNELQEPRIQATLARLLEAAAQEDPARMAAAREELGRRGEIDARQGAEVFGQVYMPVSSDAGRLLYLLARARGARCIVEFGTSFGISTIFLACAAAESGGRVVSTELFPGKVRAARENLAAAGLAGHVELREGDARETLRDLAGPVDLLFLDGWKPLYLPVLELLEGRLAPGALVIADDITLFPDEVAPYLAHVRDPGRGYTSVELGLGDGMEISLRSP